MSDNSLRNQVFETLSLKETDELLQIWQDNKRHEWSDLAFEVIEQILQERGEEIPAQHEAQIEEDDEEDIDLPPSSPNQPTFYKPQQVFLFADAASVVGWVTLIFYIVTALWYFISGFDTQNDPRLVVSGIINFLTRVLTGALSFALFKGISYALNVLMEFEFNSRNVK